MKINALLNVNVVAHETEDEVAVLLEVEAPASIADLTRPQASLQVVLDRSGSMSGAPLEGAKRALIALVRRLEPSDNFGLVTFDDSAQVVVPAGPLTDKEAVIRLIEAVHPGGSTDLSAGYLRGLREIRRVAGDNGGTVLVVSDGHVNAGIQSVDEFASVTSKAYGERIVTSTLGYGHGYDETLLSAIARSGSGNHVFADSPDAAGAAIASEVDGLLNKVVQAVSLTIHFEPAVEFLRLFNDLPATQIGADQVVVELGDLYAEEARKVLLKFKVPAIAELGLAKIATLELAYVELPGFVEQVASLPITVNVVPGDEAAGRVALPTVESEVLFQEAQEVKRQASEAFGRGEFDEGQRLIGESWSRLARSLEAAPEALKAEIRAEIDQVAGMEQYGQDMGVAGTEYMSKLSRASHHRGSRQRGRAVEPELFEPDEQDER
jgi:Ca-activated chloride channel family protein